MLDYNKLVFESHDKYLHKLDDDLIGKNYRLAMDDGEEYELRFITGDVVEWRSPGKEFKWEKYGCLKADDTTYFVASELSGTEFRTLITLVIDELNDLVTMAVSRMGRYPNRPRLVDVEFIFGAIRRPDKPLNPRRHGYSNDLVGKKITWYYSTGFINTHIYVSERYCRIRPMSANAPQSSNGDAPKEMLYDEPTRHIRIKDGMYLISFIEANMNRVNPEVGGNNLMILTNLKDGFDCGRTFSKNSRQENEHGMFRSYGEMIEEYIPVQDEPTPYRV